MVSAATVRRSVKQCVSPRRSVKLASASDFLSSRRFLMRSAAVWQPRCEASPEEVAPGSGFSLAALGCSEEAAPAPSGRRAPGRCAGRSMLSVAPGPAPGAAPTPAPALRVGGGAPTCPGEGRRVAVGMVRAASRKLSRKRSLVSRTCGPRPMASHGSLLRLTPRGCHGTRGPCRLARGRAGRCGSWVPCDEGSPVSWVARACLFGPRFHLASSRV